MKPIPLSIKVSIRPQEREAVQAHDVEDYWVGSGYVGAKETRSMVRKGSTKVRRFLRARDAKGICRYFFWTCPDRGKQVPKVFRFKKRVKITRELAEKHYTKEK
jgi:hypothetical protein